jgi:hypothetical protein
MASFSLFSNPPLFGWQSARHSQDFGLFISRILSRILGFGAAICS